MRRNNRGFLAALVFAAFAAEGVSNAATIEGPSDGVTGISDLTQVTLNGQTYDLSVTFEPISYNAAFGSGTPFFSGNSAAAQNFAVEAILALRGGDIPAIPVPATALAGGAPEFVIPYALDTVNGVASGVVGSSIGTPPNVTSWTTTGVIGSQIAAPAPGIDWAVVTATPVSPVPLPAAAWLLLSGLGGLGVFARKPRLAA